LQLGGDWEGDRRLSRHGEFSEAGRHQANFALLSGLGLGSHLTVASGAYSGTDEGAIPAGGP